MSAVDPIQINQVDPFAEAADSLQKQTKDIGKESQNVHIRVQQRNGKKCVTTVQGIPKSFDYKKILKALKKEYCCNGTVVDIDEDKEGEADVDTAKKGEKVLQLQGDQRKNVQTFLVDNELIKKVKIKIHGF